MPRSCGAIGCRLLNGDGTLQTTCVQSFPTIVNQCLDFEFFRLHFPSGLWGTQALQSNPDHKEARSLLQKVQREP